MNRFRWKLEGSCESRLDVFIEEADCLAVAVFDNFLGSAHSAAVCSRPASRLASTAF